MDCAAGSRRDTGLKPVGNRSEAGPMRISQPVPVPTNAGLDCRIGPRVRPEESTSTITHLRPPVVPVAVEIVITRTSRVDRENLPLRRLLQLQRRRKQLERRVSSRTRGRYVLGQVSTRWRPDGNGTLLSFVYQLAMSMSILPTRYDKNSGSS